MSPKNISFLIIFLIILCKPSIAIDWSDCNNYFDNVVRISDEASDISDDLDDLEDEIEAKKKNIELCKSYPESFDLLKDNCQSDEHSLKKLIEEYNTKKEKIKDLLEDLKSELRYITNETGFSF